MKKHIVLAGLLLFGLYSFYGQAGKVRNAKKSYENFAYIKTSEVLKEIAEDGYRDIAVLQKLGNSYYFNSQMQEASKWYGVLFEELEKPENSGDKPIDSEYLFRYALALKGIKNYKDSDKWMQKFIEANPEDLRSKAFLANKAYINSINRLKRTNIVLKNEDFNSPKSDFGVTEVNGNLLIASARGDGKLYKWNNQPYLDIYEVSNATENNYGITIMPDINSKLHESSAALTPDGNFLFFTRNVYLKHRSSKDNDFVNRLQLYRAAKGDHGRWENITPILVFDNEDYSVAHPTINKMGTRIYFSSDIPGGNGGSDIYVANLNKDGSIEAPQNLGPTINTSGQETFPFVNTQGDLFYATNGLPGLGGLDMFVVQNFDESQTITTEPKNMGEPINSSSDDFAYYESINLNKGYISSNREGGQGDDDIYSFDLSEKCKDQNISGILKEQDSNEVVTNAQVSLLTATGDKVATTLSNGLGQFSFKVKDCGEELNYLVRAEKEDYIGDEASVNIAISNKLTLNLKKDKQRITIGDDLKKSLDIPIIYFDLDKHNINGKASIELEKVLAVLNKYPNMEIEIKSHTDSRATTDYNNKLSNRRAQATKQYLIDRGISPLRLKAMGYGETMLVNNCSDGVACSDLEHSKNRRSEFIIVKIE